jgi:hypothetical protein
MSCASSATAIARRHSRSSSAAGDARPDDTLVADGTLGSIHAFRGDGAAARPLLLRCLDTARPLLLRCLDTATRLDVVSMGVDSAAALAVLEEQEGDLDQARSHWPLRARALVAQRGPPLNILAKLRCRSRTEAVAKAGDLCLLA